jgi:hypothetical protein
VTTTFNEKNPTFDIQVEIGYVGEFLVSTLHRHNRAEQFPKIRFFLEQMKDAVPAQYCGKTDDLNVRFRFRQPVWDLIRKVLKRVHAGPELSQQEAAEFVLRWLTLAEDQRELVSCSAVIQKEIESLGHRVKSKTSLRARFEIVLLSDFSLLLVETGTQAVKVLDSFFDAVQVEGLELFEKMKKDYDQDFAGRKKP